MKVDETGVCRDSTGLNWTSCPHQMNSFAWGQVVDDDGVVVAAVEVGDAVCVLIVYHLNVQRVENQHWDGDPPRTCAA